MALEILKTTESELKYYVLDYLPPKVGKTLEILKIIELELKYSVAVKNAPGFGEDPGRPHLFRQNYGKVFGGFEKWL
jgi:hypothetical protein